MSRIIHHIMIVVLSVTLSVQAMAHSKVEKTIPSNHAKIEELPASVSIFMASKIRLTQAEMQYEQNEPVILDISNYKSFAKEFTLPIEPMGGGLYRIKWRALGLDGHLLKGEVEFTFAE